jgi:DNA mismatch repair protein MutL
MLRIGDVLGRDLSSNLFPLSHTINGISISGAVSSPRVSRSTSKGIHLFVNGRMVRDRMLMHALFEGYRGRLVKGRFPVAVMFVNLDPERIDVNVHPTKHEVRFLEHRQVHQVVLQAVVGALDTKTRPSLKPVPIPIAQSASISSESIFERVVPFAEPPTQSLKPAPVASKNLSETQTALQQPIWEPKGFEDLKIIGQLHNTYILCESPEGLILIDQHAAHERVLYETLKHRKSGHKPPAQGLLTPETIELNFSQTRTLNQLLPEFFEMGLEIEPFGHNTFLIKSVPAILTGKEMAPMILDILDQTESIGLQNGLEPILDQSLMLMACHGAIRANQGLSKDQIVHLLRQLDRCKMPSSCPHGRPTWVRWSIKFLEKSFQRIV